jgi:hypothetical protein
MLKYLLRQPLLNASVMCAVSLQQAPDCILTLYAFRRPGCGG